MNSLRIFENELRSFYKGRLTAQRNISSEEVLRELNTRPMVMKDGSDTNNFTHYHDSNFSRLAFHQFLRLVHHAMAEKGG
jgi:hypothetical protein